MRRRVVHVAAIVLALLVLSTFFFLRGDFGVPAKNIEKNARASQQISDAWDVEMDRDEALVAAVFYPNDRSGHAFSVYVKASKFSPGYHFAYGGALPAIQEGVAAISADGLAGCAYLSLNRQQICAVEYETDKGTQTMTLDSTKPFAIVLPKSSNRPAFYDAQAQVILAQTDGF